MFWKSSEKRTTARRHYPSVSQYKTAILFKDCKECNVLVFEDFIEQYVCYSCTQVCWFYFLLCPLSTSCVLPFVCYANKLKCTSVWKPHSKSFDNWFCSYNQFGHSVYNKFEIHKNNVLANVALRFSQIVQVSSFIFYNYCNFNQNNRLHNIVTTSTSCSDC